MSACPICRAPLTASTPGPRPFCSARCKSVDLGQWLSEAYAIPLEDAGTAEDLPPPTMSRAAGDA